MSCYNYFLKKVQAIPRVEKGAAELLADWCWFCYQFEIKEQFKCVLMIDDCLLLI